ncbi:MAG: peptidase T [Anaerolineaceae bacterium]|jgi:tripeptide aminopeptidase
MFDSLERFLRYVRIDTQSAMDAESYPSTSKQLDLARLLVEELTALGMDEVKLDQYGYVTATLPANIETSAPVVGFLAHMDTSPAASGANVKPRLIENYDGQDIVLNAEKNILLSPRDFPKLLDLKGQRLVVTDGTTLLGADDKAGIAAIIGAMAYLIAHPEVPHGKLRVGFTPDEEVGEGVKFFDVPAFGADFAYTVDGGKIGEFSYETFNAASAKIKINGRSVHPGTAKGRLKSAIQVAIDFHNLLPVFDRAEHTEGREGFIHLTEMAGEAERAHLYYIIRDHDEAAFARRKQEVQRVADFINERYGAGTLELEIRDQYFNMRKMIEARPEIIEIARKAYRAAGLEPVEEAVRGGTDGSRLSYMGLPTPNIFTGGHNGHGRFEYLSVEALEKATEVVVIISKLVGELK